MNEEYFGGRIKMVRAEVVHMVGYKHGTFVQELVGPNIEPWFVVKCTFSGYYNLLRATKDANLYYAPMHEPHVLTPAVLDHYDNFLRSERVLVKAAIKRYVTEVGNYSC